MNPLAAQLAPPAPGGPAPVPPGAGGAGPGGPPPGAGGPPGMDPMSMLMSQGGPPPGPPGGDPSQQGGGPDPHFPTTDPNFMAQALSQVIGLINGDQQQLQQLQHAALVGNPLFEALVSGAPMSPGAGQDGQAIGAPSGDMPPMGGDLGQQ